MSNAAKRHALSFVAEIDEVELTVRLAEIAIGARRPFGASAAQALADIRLKAAGDPMSQKVYDDLARMARASIVYFGECIQGGSTPS